jgi:hypothetical protein
MKETRVLDLEDMEKHLRDYSEQYLRTYVATVNLRHDLNRVPLRKGEKIRVHFLYLSEYYWPSWDSFYRSCLADERLDVKVVFLDAKDACLPEFPPFNHAEDFLQTHGVPYTLYREYDPYAELPHLLIYQSPYNNVYLHFSKLKANFIKEVGIRPVYIPYGIEYDMPRTDPSSPQARLNVLHYRQYVQLFAWKIIAMHEDICVGFFRHCLAGGAHVAILGHPKFDGYFTAGAPGLPQDLLRKAAGRPLLVWQLHHFVNDLASDPARTHSLPFAQTRKIFSWLHDQDRVCSVVTLHPCFAADAVQNGQAGPADVENLREFIRRSPNMALYEGDYQTLLAGADAFVTEKSSLMLEMAFLGKPVLLLLDLQVCFKPFAADIAAAFYHGSGLEDVQNFFRILEGSAPDTLAESRKRVRETCFAGCDGQVGEKIKEYLIAELRQEMAP